MTTKLKDSTAINELDPVALLEDRPIHNLARGQVGTVVDLLDAEHVLVEFSGVDGAAYAIEPLPRAILLPLVFDNKAA